MNKITKPILPTAESEYDKRLNTVLERFNYDVVQAIAQGADGYLTQTTSVSTSYTASLNDSVVLVDSTGGSKTVVLPAVDKSKMKRMSVKKLVAANNVIVDPAGTALIENVTAYTMTTALASIDVVSDGSNWWIV